MKFLISKVETYRVSDENEAKELIESAKRAKNYTLSKYSNEHKERKQKGEVIDEWQRVILTKVYTDEKEPEMTFEEDDEDVEYED